MQDSSNGFYYMFCYIHIYIYIYYLGTAQLIVAPNPSRASLGLVIRTTRARRSRPSPHNAALGDLPHDPIYRARVPAHPNFTATNAQHRHAAAPASIPPTTEFHRRTMRRSDLISASVPCGVRVEVGCSMMTERNRWSAVPPRWLRSSV
jgi:hypothetical protein